jgi:hypothetical protein
MRGVEKRAKTRGGWAGRSREEKRNGGVMEIVMRMIQGKKC